MKVYYDKRLSDPTYYIQHGFRNGKKVTCRNIKKVGKHSELLKITDNPLAYAKDIAQQMNEEYRCGKVSFDISADFNEKVPPSDSEASTTTWLNIGYFFLQDVMKGLRLKEFFTLKTENRRMTFDCFQIARFLTYARILDPRSKLGTWDRLDSYYEKPEFDYQHILRFMDLLAENEEDYLEWLYRKSDAVVKRDSSVVYYDCTNFYCECEQQDEDIIDEITGEIISGLRKFGFSKEHRPNPIVEMGLFMDSRGIPITMCLHPGNTNEQITAIPLEKEVLKMTNGAKFIYCADGGLGSYNIRKFNSMGGRAFIVTQSIKKLSDTLKAAVFNDFDYCLLSNGVSVSTEYMKSFDKHQEENLSLYNDFAYKEINADRVVDLGLYEEKVMPNGHIKRVKATGVLKQRLIITFSRKMMEYQRAVRERQVERAKEMLKRNDPEEIKKGPNDVRRFMKRVIITDNETDKSQNKDKKEDVSTSGEADAGKNAAKIKSKETGKPKVKYILDEKKIQEEMKYDGYYAVATNLSDSAKDILAVSHKRYQIEDCFRIMKTNFTGRPINHRLPNRIRAHFLICYTALLVYRLLEAQLDDQKTHVTPENLITTLKNMNVVNIHDVEYMALYSGSKTLNALNRLSPLGLDRLHYKPKELNGKIKKILK